MSIFLALFPFMILLVIVLWALTRPKGVAARPGLVRNALIFGAVTGPVIALIYIGIGRTDWSWYFEVPYCMACMTAASVIVDCFAKGKPLTW